MLDQQGPISLTIEVDCIEDAFDNTSAAKGEEVVSRGTASLR